MIPDQIRVGRSAATLLLICLAGTAVGAQTPKPKPKAAPAAAAADARLPGALLVSVDEDVTVSVDGRTAGAYKAGDAKVVRVAYGKHVVRAISARAAGVAWESVVEVTDKGGQQVVQVVLKEQVERAAHLASRRVGANAPRGTAVLAVVDGGLAQAAASQAPSLQALRIWLESPTGGEIGAPFPTTEAAFVHAELSETAQAAPAAVTVGTNAMLSCSVTVTLSLWRGPQPAVSTFTESGAAFAQAQACATARQRSVIAALTALANTVRKDLR